jgi:uncharacterized protein (DUF58 family)
LLTRVRSTVTPAGWAVLGLGLVLWLLGWRGGWVELMAAAGVCVATVLLCLPFLVGRSPLGAEIELAPERVTVGDRALGQLRVRNVARTRVLGTRVELPVGRAVAEFRLPSLAPDEQHDELFSIPTRYRGVVDVGPTSSVRGDPLGLFRRSAAWGEAKELLVQPPLVNLETLGSGFLRDLEGQVTNHLSSSDVAFHTLRDYVPGDDRRFVHWRTSARTGRLMVRQFVDTRRSHAAIVIDTDPASYAPTEEPGNPENDEFEVAVSAAASLAVRILRDEQTLTLVAGTRRLPSSTGRSALDSLTRVMPDPAGHLDSAAQVLSGPAADASIIFLVTGSGATVGDMRRATRGTASDVRVVAVRARLGGTSAFRESGGLTLLELAQLPDLAGLVRAAVR